MKRVKRQESPVRGGLWTSLQSTKGMTRLWITHCIKVLEVEYIWFCLLKWCGREECLSCLDFAGGSLLSQQDVRWCNWSVCPHRWPHLGPTSDVCSWVLRLPECSCLPFSLSKDTWILTLSVMAPARRKVVRRVWMLFYIFTIMLLFIGQTKPCVN